MMRQGRKFGFALSCLLSALGCSSETTPDPNATVSTFCENWGRQACTPKVVLACSGADKVTTELTEDCVSSQQNFCEEKLLPVKGFSSQNATQCLRAVGEAYKDGVLSADDIALVRHRGEPCNHLVRGPQGEGESCVRDDDCDTLKNYLCVLKSGQGTCQIPTLAANGTSCAAPEAACNADFYCGTDEYCVHVKDVGSACSASFECDTGLECDADSSKCVTRVDPMSCAEDNDCTTNVCDIPVGLTTGRCVQSITLSGSNKICEDLQ